MRHFGQLSPASTDRLFGVTPSDFDTSSPLEEMAMALGATLYTPATRSELSRAIDRQSAAGVTSMVLCLEDSVPDEQLPAAIDNLVATLQQRHAEAKPGPLLFVRVRNAQQIRCVCDRLGSAVSTLTGFVLPKFEPSNGDDYLKTLASVEEFSGHRLLAMPVLESAAIADTERRGHSLRWVLERLREHRDRILAIRIGATDLSGLYGLRRPADMTIYEVRAVSAIIADIIGYLGRAEDGFVITGPVWEYFQASERIFRPRLRQTLFVEHDAVALRNLLISRDQDGLIREVELDKANGITGKTVIHPSHVPVVHSLLVVSHEEYADACDIIAAADGGVATSEYRNKMNEAKPHLAWAHRTMLRARAFGVSRANITFVDVLGELVLASENGTT